MSDTDKIDCPEYNVLIDDVAAARARMVTAGKTAVAALFKTFFAEYPEAKAVGWKQYTPHFNDGDPCTFRTRDPYLSTVNGVEFADVRRLDDSDETIGFKDEYSISDGPLKEGLCRLSRSMDDYIFEVAFGDALVIATPEGFHINSFNHD